MVDLVSFFLPFHFRTSHFVIELIDRFESIPTRLALQPSVCIVVTNQDSCLYLVIEARLLLLGHESVVHRKSSLGVSR